MKINKHYLEIFSVLLVLLLGLYLRTEPIRYAPLPYGEVDSASHYALADYTSSTNKVITDLPPYIDIRYGMDNAFKPHSLWYAPHYHLNLAIMQILTNEQPVTFYMGTAFFSLFILLGVFFLLRKLLGYWIAIISSFFLIFNQRAMFSFLWGQQPQVFAYAFIPITLYCLYRYLSTISEKGSLIYMYLTGIFIAFTFFFHPQVFVFLCLTLIMYYLLFMLIKKRFIFTKHMVYAFLLFIVLIFLFPVTTLSQIYRAEGHAAVDTPTQGDFSRLFYWFKPADFSMPPGYFSYTQNNGGWWTIPFIFLGIFFLFTKRKKGVSILLLSWLIGQYIMIHLDIFGLVRAFRALDSEAYILYPLAVIGFFTLFTLTKKRPLNTYIKVAGSIVLITLILLNNASPVISTLKGSYQLPNRINPSEYEFAQWIRTSDIPLDKTFLGYGTISSQIQRYMRTVAQRFIGSESSFEYANLTADFLIFDYSFLEQAKSHPQYKPQYDSLKAMESGLDSSNVIYDKNNIKVYKNE